MDTIATRIMQLVEETGGNMSDFARSIDVTPAYISKLKNKPESSPSTDVINKICERHHVREAWLRRGEGPMRYPDVDDSIDYIDVLLADADDVIVAFVKSFMRTYSELTPENKAIMRDFIKKLRDSQ